MALGGGNFTAMNKILPGSYINFVSAATANASVSDRGIAAIGVYTGWGKTGEVIEVSSADFQKNSINLFGMAYDADDLKSLRELFAYARTVYCYRLDGGGVKAANTFATAKYAGTKGNSITIKIAVNVDDNDKFDVSTIYNTKVMDVQTVATAADLVNNDWVDFKISATLEATAGTPLTGGTNGTPTGETHQAFLDALEPFSFNALGCASDDSTIKELYIAYCKRLRDEVGKKFQVVVHNNAADYEGVINVKNNITDVNRTGYELVYWVTGVMAGTAVNASCTNKLYDGEYDVDALYTQTQLEAAITAGEFAFHKVGQDIRILTDINSLVTTSDTKGEIFKSNQTIRVIDVIANDIAVIFNTKFLGTVPNDEEGRVALWMSIVNHHADLMRMRAIEPFDDNDINVERGNDSKTVVVTDAITVINAMEKLYMTVTVS